LATFTTIEREARMAAYVIARIWVKDEPAYQEYRQMVAPTVEKYGGRFLVRGGRAQWLEGTGDLGRIVLLEFPSYEQALAWYTSEDYAPAMRRRQASSDGELILVESL
jgi:uncharacterized protein (DUF1330 family)